MIDSNHEIEQLLRNGGPELDAVRSEMSHSTPENVRHTDVSGKAAYDIYRVRSLINDDHGGKVKGYAELLPRLQGLNDHKVRIFELGFKSVGFRIFVDLDTSTVLGVLAGRHENAN